ncbi:MAG: hypothetical protein E6K80_11670 [Candidatus Eisenbacteria bacterium]|uniref:Uncharacterized protein n=1 Tax=Eiseniibacteriota bacterium TaxID=2212470 RepID=A0A538U0Q3_UNCEI|nr:MAG: hypothetical protein E6K80_11670 [Candidatus Eisenbacteria bacterium]
MHFLDAWLEVSPLVLARLLAPLGLLIASAFLPGLRVGQVTAIGVALTLPWLRELAAPPWVIGAWVLLWLLIGSWRPRDTEESARQPLARSSGVAETHTVGLALGLALTLLLIAAVARQDMSADDTRRASLGAALLSIGILHLMLRRHIRRAMTGFAAMGLGLQILEGAAQRAEVGPDPTSAMALLVATWLGVGLALRLAIARERYAGTAWVSDAHDLHD